MAGRTGVKRHGHTGTPTFKTWAYMRNRCLDKNHKSYPYYGGAGIRICPEWDDFCCFLADMGERPVGATIERIDSTKDYCKENCRWATAIEQANNRRSNRFIEHAGKRMTLIQWSRELGIDRSTLWHRLKLGVSVERAFTKPIQRGAKV